MVYLLRFRCIKATRMKLKLFICNSQFFLLTKLLVSIISNLAFLFAPIKIILASCFFVSFRNALTALYLGLLPGLPHPLLMRTPVKFYLILVFFAGAEQFYTFSHPATRLERYPEYPFRAPSFPVLGLPV